MADMVTIPPALRERFDAQAVVARDLMKDGEFSPSEQREAEALVAAARSQPSGSLTVPATSAALVAITGSLIEATNEIPEDPPNNRKVRSRAEQLISEIRCWYWIGSEIPEWVRA